MPKTVRVIVIALATILLLSLLAFFIMQSQWARDWIEAQASQRLEGREVEIADLSVAWDWPLRVRFKNVRVANTDWAEHDVMLELETLEIVPDMGKLMSGQLGLQRLDIQRPRIHLARRADGTSNWGALVSDEDAEPPLVPGIVTVDDGRMTYVDEQLDASLDMQVHTTTRDEPNRRLVASGEGQWKGRPLQFDAWGAAPLQALDKGTSYPLMLHGSLGELQVRFDGQARDPLQPDAMHGTLELSAPEEAQAGKLLGRPGLAIPAFELKAMLERDGPRWTLGDIQLESGESHLSGAITMVREEPPRFDIQLHANRIDLNRWEVMDYLSADRRGKAPQGEDVPLAEHLAKRFAMLRGRQMQLDLAVDELIYGDRSMENVTVEAMLDGDHLDVPRLRAQQGDGQLQASGSLNIEADDVIGEVNARIEQFHLGRAIQPFYRSDLGMLDGELQARFEDGVMTLRDTELAYDAPAQNISVQFSAESRELSGEPVPGLHVQGNGLRYGEPFRFDLDLGPLLDLAAAQKPYSVQGMLASRDSTLYVDGSIVRPLVLESVDTQFRLEGPNPDRINAITRLSLPSLPPYHLEGRLRWHDGLLRLTDFAGGFGESDIAGDLRLRTGEQSMVWATLHSRSMDYDDLRPLWGSPPGTGEGEVASVEQEQMARRQEQAGQFFSSERWSPDALRRMDAKVDFTADDVNAKGIPLEGMQLELEMQNGRLTLQPLNFEIGGGTVNSYIGLDAGQSRVTGHVEASATRVGLKPLLRDDFPQVARDSAGIIGGEADFSFSGLSMADFMAGADGQLELAMSGGYLDMVAVEVLGLDVGEALVASLADADQVPIRCAYLRFVATAGEVDLEQLFIDTADSNFSGGGTIDLTTERIDLQIESHPKDVSFFSANSPVLLKGTLAEPAVRVTSAELLARGVASAIGLAVAPPLAILPWVDPGLGEGVGLGCRQVLDEFRSGQ